MSEPVRAAAVLLAVDGGAWQALLDGHVADAGGHCAGCRSTTLGAPVWPCRLWAIADEARRISGGPVTA